MNNMYNLNDPEIQSEGSDVSIFPLEISENNEIEEISTAVAENGNTFLKFIFKSEDGGKVNMFEFEVTPKDGEDQNATMKRFNSQKKRLVHIINKILPTGTQLPAATSWNDLCQKVVNVCPPSAFAGKKFRKKAVYNFNNYVSIPKYVPFIESMDVAIADSRLKIDESFDKIVKDEATPNADLATAAGAGAVPVAGGADMPF